MRTRPLRDLGMIKRIWIAALFLMVATFAGAEEKSPVPQRTARIDAVRYIPARWETKEVHEPENERPNRGGMVSIYATNLSTVPIRWKEYLANGRGETYWQLGGRLSWSRQLEEDIPPGKTGVLEMCGITDELAEGKPFSFALRSGGWRPIATIQTTLREDPLQISYLRVLPGRQSVEAHLRYVGAGPIQMESIEVAGVPTAKLDWVGRELAAAGPSIARIDLERPLAPAELFVVRAVAKDGAGKRTTCAHRRAFDDFFPIGTWSASEDSLSLPLAYHIDTVVRPGQPNAPFFTELAPRLGMRAMVHTGVLPNVDALRGLAANPIPACWMIHDEPDWTMPPSDMVMSERMTRQIDRTRPTFITLCRNVRMPEYAPIPDIACQDHYCVSAPSSSKWPKLYGTRLEETGHYTRDLKRASAPKPIWVWTQGVADWSGRPARPNPTPEEIAGQLLLNLGRGAKGILWFNFESRILKRFPDAAAAIQGWGRVLEAIRGDLLAADPADLVASAPAELDVAPLVSRDKLMLFVFNKSYQIHAKGYVWRPIESARIVVRRPSWIGGTRMVSVAPDGVAPVPAEITGDTVSVALPSIGVGGLFVWTDDAGAAQLESAWTRARARETAAK